LVGLLLRSGISSWVWNDPFFSQIFFLAHKKKAKK
jgi:hypothetical protein